MERADGRAAKDAVWRQPLGDRRSLGFNGRASVLGIKYPLGCNRGGYDRSGFTFAWPIWSAPASFAAIRALLSHPDLRAPPELEHLGVDHIRVTRRISLDRYRNFTYAEPLMESPGLNLPSS